MKKLRFIAVVALSGLMMACTSTEEPTAGETTSTATMPDIEVVKVSSNETTADFSISGMACEMNCVSSVKNTLAEMEGVETIDFPEFSGENEVNHGIVKFDPEVVSPEKMVTAIQGLYDGQYNVTHVKVEEGSAASSNSDGGSDSESGSSSATVETSTGMEMPNLLDLFVRLF